MNFNPPLSPLFLESTFVYLVKSDYPYILPKLRAETVARICTDLMALWLWPKRCQLFEYFLALILQIKFQMGINAFI